MKELRNVRPFSRNGRKDEELGDFSAFALASAPVSADFVARVMRGLPAEGVRDDRPADGWKWAAALLIFSVAVGYGFSIAEQTTESVASLTSAPSDSASSVLDPL